MKEYHVKVTASAESQIEQITQYVAFDLNNPKAAILLLDALETSILGLSNLPYRFPLVAEEPWRGKGIRIMPVNHFLVCYWINEDVGKVQVTAVIYEKREQLRQLSLMDME